MKKVIRPDNLRLFAYCNDQALKGAPRGLVLDFAGLGDSTVYDKDTPMGKMFGEEGILYCIPYLDPWNWMNGFAVRETDEIRGAIAEKYGLDAIPYVSSGKSMGGLACLVYARYASDTPKACVANCPVCDLLYHFSERPDLPRTLYSAFGRSDAATLDEAMENASPLHLAERREMPIIPYTVFHCTMDSAVNKQMHSDRFVTAMSKCAAVRSISVEGREHCDLSEDAWAEYYRAILKALK